MRTALRLMESLDLDNGRTGELHAQELCDACIGMPWEKYISTKKQLSTFSVSMTLGKGVNEGLRNSMYSSRTIQDAIFDGFEKKKYSLA